MSEQAPPAFGILRRAIDGLPIVLTRETAMAIHVALFDVHSEVGRLKSAAAVRDRHEIALVEQARSEEAARAHVERELAIAMTLLTTCAYAKDEVALTAALVDARAFLQRGGT